MIITLPWYLAIPITLLYIVAIQYVIRTIVIHYREKRLRPFAYKRITFKDYAKILEDKNVIVRAYKGVPESLQLFSKIGAEWNTAVEKAFSRNDDFKKAVKRFEKNSKEYNDMVEREMGWIHLLSDTAVEVGKRCTSLIAQYSDQDSTYQMDSELIRDYIQTSDGLYKQYRRLIGDTYIPETIRNDIEMVYRIFFDYFELVNAHVEIL